MTISIRDFWQQAVKQRLVSKEEARQLHAEFKKISGASSTANAASLSQWLISTNKLTKQQCRSLLSGDANNEQKSVSISRPQNTVTPLSNQASGSKVSTEPIDSSVLVGKRSNRKNKFGMPLLTALISLAIFVIAAIVVLINAGKEPEGEYVANTDGTSDSSQPKNVKSDLGAATAREREAGSPTKADAVDDDGVRLWQSPTRGEAYDFRFVPPECQFVLNVRPSELLATSQGRRLLQSLGPDFDLLLASWKAAAGFELDQLERLQVSLVPHEDTRPRPVIAAWLLTEQDLESKWTNAKGITKNDAGKSFRSSGWRFFIPKGTSQMFVMGEEQPTKDIIESSGNRPPLPTAMEKLRAASDQDRQITLLADPQFFFADGRGLFTGSYESLREPLRWLFDDRAGPARTRTFMASLDIGQLCFGEVQFYGTADRTPFQIADTMKERLNQLPRRLEDNLVSLEIPPYWRRLALRLPLMAEELRRQSRFGVEQDRSVFNFVLPPEAAHNFALALELSLNGGSTPAVVKAEPTKPQPKTMEDVLQTKLSVDIPQTSLEFAMRELSATVSEQTKLNVEIKIIGGDLQKDGITRNQQIRNFKAEDESVAEVLTNLVMQANPVTTVQSASEKDQKLVWVESQDAESANRLVIMITTRNAAEAKGLQLPPAFQPR